MVACFGLFVIHYQPIET